MKNIFGNRILTNEDASACILPSSNIHYTTGTITGDGTFGSQILDYLNNSSYYFCSFSAEIQVSDGAEEEPSYEWFEAKPIFSSDGSLEGILIYRDGKYKLVIDGWNRIKTVKVFYFYDWQNEE